MPKLQDEANAAYRRMFAYACAFSQVVLVILYATLTEYGPAPGTNGHDNSDVASKYQKKNKNNHISLFLCFPFVVLSFTSVSSIMVAFPFPFPFPPQHSCSWFTNLFSSSCV